MNVIDALAVVLVVFAAIAGHRSGALPQLGGILGAVAVGEMIGSGLGGAVGHSLGRGVLSTVDRGAGMVVGVAQALLILWLAGGLLAVGPLPRISSQVQTSTAIRALTAILPPPVEFADGLGRLLDASGLPDVFVGLEPPPAENIQRPSDPQAERIAHAAIASTARIAARACGASLSGTGFVVAAGYLVTNAHVVAGSDRVWVVLGQDVFDAKVVMFDPELDIAVIRAPDVRAPALRFAARDPGRGTGAAAIGYPEAGPLSVVAAAVAADYLAVGRDIYGRGRIRREILELRADIQQGDSGGPLVLPDGTVGGVVFAESRTEPDVGYALAPVPVSIAVEAVLGRTAAVGTGRCAR